MENRKFFDLTHGFVAVCKSKTVAWGLIRNACHEGGKEIPTIDKIFESDFAYECHHVPSGEDWVIIGIDIKGGRVCAAGYPPSIGKLKDCVSMSPIRKLTEDEKIYRENNFGSQWM